jgi:uncharacterized protein (TIGR00369 family)
MNTDSEQQRQPLLVMDGGPERTFRVGRSEVAYDGEPGDVTATMVTGPWLTGLAGTVPGGTLGVLADNALAFALLHDRVPAMWSVSAEISVDLCGPVPADGSLLTARARRVHFGEKGGLASGTVTGPDGTVIAQCSQHTRWVPGPPLEMDLEAWAAAGAAGAVPADVVAAAGGPASLTELLGARLHAADGGAVLELPATEELANPLGNMHGGVTFCAVDFAAHAALQSVGGPAHTASVHVAYLRPIPPGAVARFEAQVVHSGRSLGLVQVTALNEVGKPCIAASVTTGPAHAQITT